jgi:ATP-dependent helicase/nuclease subunit A
LQAPVVFLPDTLQVPRQSPRLLWSEAGLPLWLARRDMVPPPAATALSAAIERRDQEYRRLLYVALTRAEDRLYVCGWHTRQKAASHCWYGLVSAGLAAAGAEAFAFDTTGLIGAEGWAGEGRRLLSPQDAKPRAEELLATFQHRAELPDWTGRPPPPEPSPARPLAPSRPQESEPAVRSPLGSDAGLGFRRGRLIHRLLQSLPELPAESRPGAARRFLARPVHGLTTAEQEAMLRETLAILDDPTFAPLFAPGSRAEVPVVGLFGGLALSGQIDRLVVTPDGVLIVDYKTLRPPPRTEAEVPGAYLVQLAAYRAAVAAIYPGRPVRCALLWTDGPSLMPVSAERLDRHVPAALERR